MAKGLKKVRKQSSLYFTTAALFGLASLMFLNSAVLHFIAAGPWYQYVTPGAVSVIFAYLAWRNFSYAKKIKGLTEDHALLAAALYDTMINSQDGSEDALGGIIRVHSTESDEYDKRESAPKKPSRDSSESSGSSLEALREARKRPDETD